MNKSHNPVVFNSPPVKFQNPLYPYPPHTPVQLSQFRTEAKPLSSHPYYQSQQSAPAPLQNGNEFHNQSKFKEMTDDLAKLKQQLQGIMSNSSAQKIKQASSFAGNKSVDNLFSPYKREQASHLHFQARSQGEQDNTK